MRLLGRRIPPGLFLALGLLLAAVAVDSFWVRPQEKELKQAVALKLKADQAARSAAQERAEWDAISGYVVSEADSGRSWRDTYQEQDPLHLLEDLRKQARLRRLDVQLGERQDMPPFLKTEYFLSVYGDYARHLNFLKSLEQAAPLASVESFVMDTGDNDRRVTFKLNIAVLNLPAEESP